MSANVFGQCQLDGSGTSTMWTLGGNDSDSDEGSNPCFPGSATVAKAADGTPIRIAALKQGDSIKVLDRNGRVTTDTISGLSIAQPQAAATFLTLTTTDGANLTLTPEHHLPVGVACCLDLKQAKEVAIGESIYQVNKEGAAVVTTVAKITKVTKQGLHSPVTTTGTYPIVDGFVTAFDSAIKVHLASYAVPLLEATGATALFRRAFLPSGNKYIE